MKRKLGGFYALELPENKIPYHFYNLWNVTEKDIKLHNARSCLFYLLKSLQTKTIWLPAYICASVPEALSDLRIEIKFYPITDLLSPDLSYIKKNCRDSDAFLAVNYFGKSPEQEFIDYTRSRPHIHWIEDCAQSMKPNLNYWGNWRIYSPRKLLGAPDGGILINHNSSHLISLPSPQPIQTTDFINPSLLRFEDPLEDNNMIWHQQHQTKEKAMFVSNLQISQVTDYILRHTEPLSLIKIRIQNYQCLMNFFQNIKLFPANDIQFSPSGFPIRIKNRDFIQEALIKNNIFSQVHWRTLPEKTSDFSFENKLANEILTIPCDHRYDLADLKIIANCLEKSL